MIDNKEYSWSQRLGMKIKWWLMEGFSDPTGTWYKAEISSDYEIKYIESGYEGFFGKKKDSITGNVIDKDKLEQFISSDEFRSLRDHFKDEQMFIIRNLKDGIHVLRIKVQPEYPHKDIFTFHSIGYSNIDRMYTAALNKISNSLETLRKSDEVQASNVNDSDSEIINNNVKHTDRCNPNKPYSGHGK